MTARRALAFSLICLASFPALAANEIKVVNPDGSVSVLELPAAPIVEMPRAAPPPAPKPVPVTAPAPKPSSKPAPVREAKTAAPDPEPAPPVARDKILPLKPEPMGRVVAKKVEPPAITGPLDADAATRIAIGVAPPARGFEVTRRTYNDRPAFMVTFKTENGPHDVLVDAQNGDVLKR